MAKRAYGLEYIKIGAIEADGGMSTSLAALGTTYKDSAEFMQDDAEVTEHFCEENNDPEEVIAIEGAKRIKWAINDYDPDTLVKILGGTATGTAPSKYWEPSDTNEVIERSVEFKDTNSGYVCQMPRVRLYAKINWKISKNGLALIEITGRVLTPNKSGVKSIKWLPAS